MTEAAALYEDVHSCRTDQLGAAHPDSLRTACNLGRCYTRLKRTDTAIVLLTDTRTAAMAVLGDADELTLAAAHNLSEAHAARGEYFNARQLALASLEARRRVCGELYESISHLTSRSRCRSLSTYLRLKHVALV